MKLFRRHLSFYNQPFENGQEVKRSEIPVKPY